MAERDASLAAGSLEENKNLETHGEDHSLMHDVQSIALSFQHP